MKNYKNICVIPARGGSKGIPRKNLQLLGGKTLLAWAIEVARQSGLFFETLVSTDDKEIQGEAIKQGASCPFLRPANLSGDRIATYPVIKHALEEAENRLALTFDFVMVLQPSSPLRNADDLKESFNLLIKSNAPSLVSLCRIVEPVPDKLQCIIDGRVHNFLTGEKGVSLSRRQDAKESYALNGAIYLSQRTVLNNSLLAKDVIAYVMPFERSVNIDTIFDLEFARCLLNRGEKS